MVVVGEPSKRGREFVGSEVAAGAIYISSFFCFVVNAIFLAREIETPAAAGTHKPAKLVTK
jgi:hypothetical protein